ncbi:MAG: hypothetical protein ACXV8Q_07505 [Methylobacter sp.]
MMFIPPDSVFFDFIFATFLTLSLPFVGIAVFHAFAGRFNFERLEIFTYGTGIGILFYAVIGSIVGNIPSHQQAVAIALIIGINAIAAVYWSKVKLFAQLKTDTTQSATTAWSAWLLLILICITISHATIKFPDDLFDGPYVFKNHNLHVKVQTITGHLPADNYLPYLVEEYFLRGISFQDEHPILPGQEVTNRPILMALVAIPFRAALDPPPRQNSPLPKFQYVGALWPDVGTLGEDRYFRQFLVVGIVLNAMFILGAALLFKSFGLTREFTVAGLLLLVINPYFISQVIFTWPKALAAFYILLAIQTLSVRGWPAMAGLFAALAYLSHPYAVVFAGSFAVYLGYQVKKNTLSYRQLIHYGGAFSVVVAPWFIWAKFILKLPSDLIAQNLFNGGSLVNTAWVRIPNLYLLVSPRFLEIFPFNGDQILQASLVCIPGAIGVLFFAQAYAGCQQYFAEHKFLILYGVLVPGLLLVMIFSTPSVPALHGFQAIFPILILLSIKWMQNRTSSRALLFLVIIQLTVNIALLCARADTLGIFNTRQVASVEAVANPQEVIVSKKDGPVPLLAWLTCATVKA